MPKKLVIGAEEIVDYAKRNGLKMKNGGIGHSNDGFCARAVIKHSLGLDCTMYHEKVYEEAGLTKAQIDALEEGFEYGTKPHWQFDMEYHRMGQRIAELAGL